MHRRGRALVSSSESESEEESFGVGETDDSKDNIGLANKNELRYREAARQNVIEESSSDDNEEQTSSRSSLTIASNTSDDAPLYSAEGRATPSIHRAIRRSLHRIAHDSEDEEVTSEDIKTDDASDSDEPPDKNESREIEDSDTQSEVEESPRIAKKVTRIVDNDSSDVEYVSHTSATKAPIHEIESSSDEMTPKKFDVSSSDLQKKINQSIDWRAPVRVESSDDEVDDDDDHSTHIIAESESSREEQLLISDDSMANQDISGNSARGLSPDSVSTSFALSMAREQIANTTIDPITAQKRAELIYKQQQLETKLAKSKKLYSVGAINKLPDGGEKLRLSIASTEKELTRVLEELRTIPAIQTSPDNRQLKNESKPATLFKQDSLEINPVYLKPTMDSKKELGKKALETMNREQSLTVERLQDLHGSLVARPAEDERAKDPRGLRVSLLPHQQHALAWLLWREGQRPRGGVLADDMGLGKTLTMISLVMAAKEQSKNDDSSGDEEEWQSNARQVRYPGGTLVVVPASVASQWESEIKNRCKPGILTVELHHGNNRETVAKRLARNDIVITTYNIVSRAFKTNGPIFKIRWKRIILDEAHVVRNHKSQTCESVCGLTGINRWALTGTPIHNKEMDLYSILKFLRCSPFDDVRVWKRWVDNKNAAGHERLATVMKTLMLRRTKQELQAKGTLPTLPDKSIEVIDVTLDAEERLVYDKVMVYSRTIFAQYLAQRAEKAHMFELGAGKYDKPSWMATHKNTQFTKAQNKLLSMHADVQSHEILVLLLRLRQVCCHPSLIHSMLDREDVEQEGGEEAGGGDFDLMAKMNNMNLQNGEEEADGEIGVDERITEHLLTSENPVFDQKRQSSKMRAVLAKVEEILETRDKLIIVSQWAGVLDIVAEELNHIKGASWRMFTGKVAVKDRQGIMDDFNSKRNDPNILLLSLTAGGVGLNLVGANHLLLIDIHWNPQLENQAQDRIYRFGQTKDVYVYKYICTDTIEERIKALQERKMELANAVLSGGGKIVGSKLSLDDIRSLFGL